MWQSKQQVDSIRIASPCKVGWESMEGDERVRFCGACRLHVYNLAEMDVEEAAELISGESPEVCVRLYRRRDGTVLTRDCPVGRRIVVARNRATRWGVLAASAGLVLSLHPLRGRTPNTRVQAMQSTPAPLPPPRTGRRANPFAATLGEVTIPDPDLRMGRIARAPRNK